MAAAVIITYGNGDKKKSCVRMKAISVQPDSIDLDLIGDYYIPNAALAELGNPKEVVVTLTTEGKPAAKKADSKPASKTSSKSSTHVPY